MGEDILAIDVGTSRFKLAVYGPDLRQRCQVVQPYDVNVYDRVYADIEPEKWWDALRRSCCRGGRAPLRGGGRVAVGDHPRAHPDARRRDGARPGHPVLRRAVSRPGSGDPGAGGRRGTSCEEACNLPVSGGSSLCSIMWIREAQPEVWAAAAMFGHTNTYMVKRLTGEWAIDPSTASITGLYNTARHDLTWNQSVLEAAGLAESCLPPLRESHEVAGTILPEVARGTRAAGGLRRAHRRQRRRARRPVWWGHRAGPDQPGDRAPSRSPRSVSTTRWPRSASTSAATWCPAGG